MSNSNCLAGFKCPKCGYRGRFDIEGKTIFTFTDSGEDEYFDIEWEDHSYCKCRGCGFEATVSEFTGKGVCVRDPVKGALLDFCEAIENTGGLRADGCPVADKGWLDLGDAYLTACAATGRKPMQEEKPC